MELELLDHLDACDEPLRMAWLVFDVDNNPANLERARHAVRMQAGEGLLQIVDKSDGKERVVGGWEIKQVLADEDNWKLLAEEAKYFLHLTDKGVKLL